VAREDARCEADRAARDYLQAKYADRPLLPGELDDEQNLRFLMAALRDKDNPVAAFCPVADVDKLRSALIAKQISWLFRQYKRFVANEYREVLSNEELAELDKEMGLSPSGARIE